MLLSSLSIYLSITVGLIAMVCEYDALPEIGHACGHNLIAEVGVGAGIGVKAAMDATGISLGKVCTSLFPHDKS